MSVDPPATHCGTDDWVSCGAPLPGVEVLDPAEVPGVLDPGLDALVEEGAEVVLGAGGVPAAELADAEPFDCAAGMPLSHPWLDAGVPAG